jgi:intein-encoded DNA endonuclease-like protein
LVEAKSRKFLKDGNVMIQGCTKNSIYGRVRGSKGNSYRVEVYRDGTWNCECGYFQKTRGKDRFIECSHALAMKLTDLYKKWILVDINGGTKSAEG